MFFCFREMTVDWKRLLSAEDDSASISPLPNSSLLPLPNSSLPDAALPASPAALEADSENWFAAVRASLPQEEEEPSFSESNLVAIGGKLVGKLKTCCMDMAVKRRVDSLAWHEALAVVSASVLFLVDVLIESGVASGFSAEVWARFFAGTHVKIYAIDKDCEGRNDTGNASRRLSVFPNVEFIKGDSIREVPKLVERHSGQRIGVFVDGPKAALGTHLMLQAIEKSPDVKFAALHDAAEWGLVSDKLYAAHNSWDRVVLRTWQPGWQQEFSGLDGCWSKARCGWGLLLAGGVEATPLSPEEDKFHRVLK